MTVAFAEIKKYSVSYFAGGKKPTGYGYFRRAEIQLGGDDNKWLGRATFHRSLDTIPDTDSRTDDGFIGCHYRWEDFPQVLDLLRNEEPVFLCWGELGETYAWIGTSKEPVGEGEEPLSAFSKKLGTRKLSERRKTTQ